MVATWGDDPEAPELATSNVAAPLVRGIAGGLPALDWALDKAGVLAARLDARSTTVGNEECCTENLVVGARADDTGFSAKANMGLDLPRACIASDICMVTACGANCGLNM